MASHSPVTDAANNSQFVWFNDLNNSGADVQAAMLTINGDWMKIVDDNNPSNILFWNEAGIGTNPPRDFISLLAGSNRMALQAGYPWSVASPPDGDPVSVYKVGYVTPSPPPLPAGTLTFNLIHSDLGASVPNGELRAELAAEIVANSVPFYYIGLQDINAVSVRPIMEELETITGDGWEVRLKFTDVNNNTNISDDLSYITVDDPDTDIFTLESDNGEFVWSGGTAPANGSPVLLEWYYP